MKVTLIYVGIGVAGFNANRPAGDREGSWIGHGIASVGASAKAAGYDVDLIDLRQLSGWDKFREIIKKNPSIVYGLSVSAVDHQAALKTILEIKSVLPQSKVVVGGIHPTIFPEKYSYRVIDAVVQGEGEVTFVELLNKMKNGESFHNIIQGTRPDLDEIPWVDRELFDYHKEMECSFAPGQSLPSITMLAGRGCPYHCNYCQPAENAVFGKPHRMRSPINVINELCELRNKYNYESITFWDDTFTFNRKWIMEFCDLYEDQGFDASIAACSRADIICNNEDMVKRLSEIGLDWFVIGLESGSQRILDLIKKGTTVEQNKEAVDICRKYGIRVFGTYMYGMPTETKEDSLATAKMIKDINPDHASPFWFVPIPGTGLYKYCEENNLILSETKQRTIERTNNYKPTIRGVDYNYITAIMQQLGGSNG